MAGIEYAPRLETELRLPPPPETEFLETPDFNEPLPPSPTDDEEQTSTDSTTDAWDKLEFYTAVTLTTSGTDSTTTMTTSVTDSTTTTTSMTDSTTTTTSSTESATTTTSATDSVTIMGSATDSGMTTTNATNSMTQITSATKVRQR